MQTVLNNLFCGTTNIVDLEVEFETQTKVLLDFKLFKIFIRDYLEFIPILLAHLNSEEKRRFEKYHFDKDRNRFIIARSLLKIVLAKEIGLEAKEVEIKKGFLQKPFLPSHPRQFFNITHSGDYILIILGNGKVGVDVEKIDENQDFSDTIPTIFNQVEMDVLSLSNNKTKTFYKFWTRKEAFVKATGKGIDDDFKNIPATDGNHNLPIEIAGKINNLVTLSFDIDENHIGALTFEGDYNESLNQLHFKPLPNL